MKIFPREGLLRSTSARQHDEGHAVDFAAGNGAETALVGRTCLRDIARRRAIVCNNTGVVFAGAAERKREKFLGPLGRADRESFDKDLASAATKNLTTLLQYPHDHISRRSRFTTRHRLFAV